MEYARTYVDVLRQQFIRYPVFLKDVVVDRSARECAAEQETEDTVVGHASLAHFLSGTNRAALLPGTIRLLLNPVFEQDNLILLN